MRFAVALTAILPPLVETRLHRERSPDSKPSAKISSPGVPAGLGVGLGVGTGVGTGVGVGLGCSSVTETEQVPATVFPMKLDTSATQVKSDGAGAACPRTQSKVARAKAPAGILDDRLTRPTFSTASVSPALNSPPVTPERLATRARTSEPPPAPGIVTLDSG